MPDDEEEEEEEVLSGRNSRSSSLDVDKFFKIE